MLIDELMLINPDGKVFRRMFKDQHSMIRYAQRFNGKKDVYYSVYQFTDTDVNEKGKKYPTSPIIDKIYLDFDAKDDPNFPNHVRKVAKFLYDNDYYFWIRFSGRGFHIFIALNSNDLDYPANAIRGWVTYLHKITGTKSDSSVVGDLRRVSRSLHCINLKSNRYCIPISYDELMYKSYDEICDIAKQDRNCQDICNGHFLLDITEYDVPGLSIQRDEIEYSGPVEFREDISYTFPPCVKAALSNPELGHKDRLWLIIYLRDVGYSKEEIEAVFKKYLSPEKYHHAVHQEHQIKYVYEKKSYLFPSCLTNKKDGRCPDEHCEGIRIYY